QAHWIGYVGGVDQPGSQRSSEVSALHSKIGAVVILQVVANRVIVGNGVTSDVFVGAGPRHFASGLADHDGQLALVVHVRHALGTACLAEVSAEASGAFQENQR